VSRRQQREKQVMTMPEPAARDASLDSELAAVLDQELQRLPAKYRAAIVLCDLEGRTRKQAADQLRLPEGTVASRLARARGLLASRLQRLGLGVAAGAVNEALSRGALASTVPPQLLATTIQALSAPNGGTASAKAVLIAEAVLRGMLVRRLVGPTLALMGLLMLGGLGGLMYAAPTQREQALATAPADAQSAPDQGGGAAKDDGHLDHLFEQLHAIIRFHIVQLHNLLHPPAQESPPRPEAPPAPVPLPNP
jgi:RNA polymerase sigma-70 factor (ECF subfamily)